MSDELDEVKEHLRSLDGAFRDLVQWLKTEQRAHFNRIDNALGLIGTDLASHSKQIADLKVDVHEHGKRITALEERQKKRGKK